MFGRHLTAEIKEKIEERVRLYETEYEKKSGSWLNKVAQLATEMIGGNCNEQEGERDTKSEGIR